MILPKSINIIRRMGNLIIFLGTLALFLCKAYQSCKVSNLDFTQNWKESSPYPLNNLKGAYLKASAVINGGF